MNLSSAPASLLFVPGSMPDRWDKALATAADCICIDLEDSVAPDQKAAARDASLKYLQSQTAPARFSIRVNSISTRDGMLDTVALSNLTLPIQIMLPKVDEARDVEIFSSIFPVAPPIIALIETPRGVENCFSIARASAVTMIMFGSFDYAAETGGSQSWSALLPVRSRIVAGSAAAHKPVIDSPFQDLTDTAAALVENRQSRELGFAGRAAIHPRMVSDINASYASTAEEIAEARMIVAAFENAEGGVARVGNKLIEKPVFLRMKRLLERAETRG